MNFSKYPDVSSRFPYRSEASHGISVDMIDRPVLGSARDSVHSVMGYSGAAEL